MYILLADDDEDDQLTFREALREVDSSIVLLSASNGIEALGILANLDRPPAHIFLDINMPLLGGIDCLKKIRKNSTFVPATIYSTANPNNEINDYIKLGADYWQKPYSYNDIVRGLKLRLKKISTADLKQLVDEGATNIRRAFKGLNVVIAEIDNDLRYKWIENPHPDFKPNEVIGKRDKSNHSAYESIDNDQERKLLPVLPEPQLDQFIFHIRSFAV